MKAFLATVLLTFYVSGAAFANSCFDLFKDSKLQAMDTELVSFVHVEPDQFGFDQFFYIDKPDADFSINRVRSDPHGDGDIVPNLFGNNASYFWGYERIGVNDLVDTYGTPTAESLNFRIDIFDKHSDEYLKVPFRFLEASESVISEKKYVQLHYQKLFPIASKGWVRMHDLNYHVMSMLIIPRPYHEAAFLISEIVFKFDEFIQARKDVRHNEKSYSNVFMRVRARDIDLTGNLILYMRDYWLHSRNLEELLKEKNELYRYARPGVSAMEYLRDLIRNMDANNNFGASKKMMEQSLQEFLEQLSMEDRERFSSVRLPPSSLQAMANSVQKYFPRFYWQTIRVQEKINSNRP